jgi:hypothetical protein
MYVGTKSSLILEDIIERKNIFIELKLSCRENKLFSKFNFMFKTFTIPKLLNKKLYG